MATKPKTGKQLERFEAKIERIPEGGCWLWMGACKPKGYGNLMVDGQWTSAHRFAYEQYIGPIPDGFLVLHRCDVPQCCNPAHLFIGTQGDNLRDMARKGRQALQRLSVQQVEAIRMDSRHPREIAKEYGVSAGHIRDIQNRRKSWLHVG